MTAWLHHHLKLSCIGLIFGVAGYFMALTPSLMPRPALFMGLIAGINFTVWYGFGLIVSACLRWLKLPEPAQSRKQTIWRLTLVVIAVLIVIFGVMSANWQNSVRIALNQPVLQGTDILSVLLISILTAAGILALSRQIRRLYRYVDHKLAAKARVIPSRLAALLSVVIVAVVIGLTINGVVLRGLKLAANNFYRSSNQQTQAGANEPSTSLRSGGPASLVSWASLGRQGRNFVGQGPTPAQLTAFSAQPALQPIRVYAGIDSADTIQGRANLALAELERTGAFNRQVLVVMTTTGSGWIDPQSSDAIEYMYNGNTALATIQYSYLPSWMALLANRGDATSAGQTLFDTIYAKWRTLPAASRPKLYAYGLSLGSFGGQSAFSGASDLAARTDGALFMGTPGFSFPWTRLTTDRAPGSPEILPVYQDGTIVRFAATSADITADQSNWQGSRTLYMQHPSDPVVWWSPSYLFSEPDWLKEPRGYDVSPHVHWYPFITFLQLTVDQFFANDVPGGHGHDYGSTIADAWQAVTQPANWSASQSAKLQHLINTVSAQEN
ncbi:alpha/beta-hydrolase family protein [Candidatus Saccharibacteria bacterium]|nr:alpha/beta-hydrolase family protein [Candidatus Saccharibacteria bacterium]